MVSVAGTGGVLLGQDLRLFGSSVFKARVLFLAVGSVFRCFGAVKPMVQFSVGFLALNQVVVNCWGWSFVVFVWSAWLAQAKCL